MRTAKAFYQLNWPFLFVSCVWGRELGTEQRLPPHGAILSGKGMLSISFCLSGLSSPFHFLSCGPGLGLCKPHPHPFLWAAGWVTSW